MMSPAFLRKGDKIRIVAPAKRILLGELDFAIEILENWGLKVILGKNIYVSNHYLAGTDEQRASDLQTALDDQNCKAVFCARGGYGTSRIIDQLHFDQFEKHPKWIIGFSDITVLLMKVNQLGFTGIHGLMPFLFEKRASVESLQTLYRYLFGLPLEYELNPYAKNKNGVVTAPIVGGNLSLVAFSFGTGLKGYEIDFKNKILFLEEVGENYYAVDRMINHLRLNGVFDQISGLILGAFNGMSDDDEIPYHHEPYAIIDQYLSDYDFPIAYGFPAGHIVDNRAIPFGPMAFLAVTDQGMTLQINAKEKSVLVI